MTPSELWRAVGEALLVQRTRLDLNPTDVQRRGGPHYQTIQATERGEVGRVDKLSQHAEALGLSIVDVLRSVLTPEQPQFTPELWQIVRAYEHGDVRKRHALVTIAQVFDADEGERPAEPIPPRGPKAR